MAPDPDFSGKLSFLNLGELLQLLGSSNATGVLRISTGLRPEPGIIRIEKGSPVDASVGSLGGQEALFSLFGWLDGRFEFTLGPVSGEKTIKKGRMEIILDGLRLLDEGKIEVVGPRPEAAAEEPSADQPARSDLPALIRGPLVDYSYVVDEESFFDGDEIVREGAHGNWIWVILEGVAEIVKTTPRGNLKLLRIGDGSFLGSVAALLSGDSVRNTTAVASGNIQLGMLDSQLLSGEIANLSTDFKSLLRSLDNRLRLVTNSAADVFQRQGTSADLLKDRKIVIREGQAEDRLFRIREGEVVIARTDERGHHPLAVLQRGDFFGHIPFLTIGHEPYAASVFATPDLKLATMDTQRMESEYRRLSATLRNIIEHLAACISATTLITINLKTQKGG
jgi:CRP-like cAMP-binding protein